MAKLTSIEKLKLEKIFDMASGYVLDFSNRTIQEFVFENTGIDIYDEKYNYFSGSKAKRLRSFWDQESNYITSKLLSSLLEYWRSQKIITEAGISETEQVLYEECLKIAEKLKQESTVENIDAIHPNIDDKNFSLLAESIRESIEKNRPEGALDRLHTFVVRYVRELCDKHGIKYVENTPLHSLFGGYVKYLRENNLIESEMTERILKSSISVLEAFNDVRNKQSFAHDNPILNYNESILIFNDVANVIRFIESIEPQQKNPGQDTSEATSDMEDIKLEDIPF